MDFTSIPWVNAVSWVGTSIWMVVLLPQFFKTLITKDTYSLSIWMYLFMLTSSLIWVSFDVTNLAASMSYDIIAEIVCDGSSFLCSLAIMIIKLVYMIRSQHLNLSEKDYWSQYLDPKSKKRAKTH